jgi:hypothetical protein
VEPGDELVMAAPGIPADSVRRAVEAVFARPEYHWAPTARPLYWLRALWADFVNWLNRLDTTHPLVYRLIFWGAVSLLFALLAHLAFTAWRIYTATVAPSAGTMPPAAPVTGGPERALARAEALARDGRYTEALAHRFLALLLQLDQQHALTFHPAKTPAEYVREARLGDDGRASFAGLVSQLYRHVFGADPCDARAYRDFGVVAGVVSQRAAPH